MFKLSTSSSCLIQIYDTSYRKSSYTFLISSKNRSSRSIRIRETGTIRVDGEEEKEKEG